MPMIEKIVQTAKLAVNANVLSHNAAKAPAPFLSSRSTMNSAPAGMALRMHKAASRGKLV
jgi:hypothetical protein